MAHWLVKLLVMLEHRLSQCCQIGNNFTVLFHSSTFYPLYSEVSFSLPQVVLNIFLFSAMRRAEQRRRRLTLNKVFFFLQKRIQTKQSGNLISKKTRIFPGGKLSYSYSPGQNLSENAIKHCLSVCLRSNPRLTLLTVAD